MTNTILAIETSCDETSVAVMRDGEILSNVIYSQLDLHKQYGGVVPSIAKLAHEQKIDDVLNEAVSDAEIKLEEVNYIAVTQGPGLAIALEVGIRKAKELSIQLNIPLVTVNHMAGHLYSGLMQDNKLDTDVNFPAMGLLVSGKHSEILSITDLFTIEKLGQTVDDACGEAFDKFATMIGLQYPGGPVISKLAAEHRGRLDLKFERDQQTLFVRAYEKGDGGYVKGDREQGRQDMGSGTWDDSQNPQPTTQISHPTTHIPEPKYQLPIPMANSGDLNMSYSGLKTAVKQLINNLSGTSIKTDIQETGRAEKLSQEQIGELCVVFETAALYTLVLKLEAAIKQSSPWELWLGGGVASSPRLQDMLQELATTYDLKLRIASDKRLLTDNAGMIAVAAHIALKQFDEQQTVSANIAKIYEPPGFSSIDRNPNWSL